MDFFFDDLPSTSRPTPSKGHEDPITLPDPDCDLSRKSASGVRTAETEEQHSSSYIDEISKKAQEIVEKINHKRTRDQEIMDSFQEQLMGKVTEMCQQMKERMYSIYEHNNHEMTVKLQELTELLENCSKLNNELLGASQALACLREGLDVRQRSEP